MNSIELLSNIKIDLSIKSRSFAKNTIINNNIAAKDFLKLISNSQGRDEMLYVSVLDYLIEEIPNYLNKDIDTLIVLQSKFINETCKRSSTRIIYHMLISDEKMFSKKQKKELIDIHFDWLIEGSQVATRVNCMSVLFLLRKEANWLLPDLVAVIEQQSFLQEPSFVSRAKKILAKIHKEANK